MADKPSYKNVLQELCVQRGFPSPVYTTTITGGTGHSPVFRTVLKVANREYTYSDSLTRREVELRCAKIALDDIGPRSRHGTPVPQQPQNMRSPPPINLVPRQPTVTTAVIPTTIVLVDLDNCDISTAIIQASNAMFYIFVSKNSAKNFTQYRGLDNCVVQPAPTTVRDATDTLMIYEARGLRDKYPAARFIIFTRDHFGETLSLLVQGQYICYIKDLEDTLPSA